MERIDFRFEVVPNRRKNVYAVFRVTAGFADGRTVQGEVRFWSARHIPEPMWEATGADGHRAEHQFWWQAVWAALLWDGEPRAFPVVRSRERLIRAGTLAADQQRLDGLASEHV